MGAALIFYFQSCHQLRACYTPNFFRARSKAFVFVAITLKIINVLNDSKNNEAQSCFKCEWKIGG